MRNSAVNILTIAALGSGGGFSLGQILSPLPSGGVDLLLAPHAHGFTGSLAGAGIVLGALTAHGQPAAMADAAIAADLYQALDIGGYLPAEIPFHLSFYQ